MARVQISDLDPDIWVGWSHLEGSYPKLSDITHAEQSIDLSDLSADTLKILYQVQQKNPQILKCKPGTLKLDKSAIRAILLEVKHSAKADSGFKVRRRFLEVIEAGNALGRFDIPIPYVPAPLPPMPPSPFTHDNMQKRAKITPLLEAFNRSLKETRCTVGSQAWWGQVLLSAMLNGALVDSVFLMELLKSLVEGKHDPRLRWVSLYPVKGKNPPKHPVLRRWFIDPVTRLILVSSSDQQKLVMPELKRVSDGQNVYGLISAYAKHHEFSDKLPGGIKALLDGVRARLHLHMPPWLVQYASDRLVSTSLPEHVWDRLIHPPAKYFSSLTSREMPALAGPVSLVGDSSDESQEEGEEGEHEQSNIPMEKDDALPVQLRELGGVLNSKLDEPQKRVKAWLAANDSELLPSVRILGLWAAEYLLAKGRGRRVKRPRTTYQMVNCIAGRLVGQLGRLDLTKLGDEEAYLEVYQVALEDTPSNGVRRIVGRALKSLHQYLESKHGVVPLSDHDIFRVSGRGNAAVDANLISLDSCLQISNHLEQEITKLYGGLVGKNEAASALVQQLQVVLSLGFFCGLRRSEVLGLQIQDIDFIEGVSITQETPPEFWIEICKNGLRELKSRSANRLLPAFALMPAHALIAVRNLWVLRRNQIRASDKAQNPDTHDPLKASTGAEPLFNLFVKNGKANDRDPNLERLTKALKHLNDDEGLRFHHLRHSFANWLAVMFWLGEQGKGVFLPQWFLPTEHDSRRLMISASVRQSLLGSAPTNTRSMLQISSLMGHAGLDITMGSYIHLADFILGRMVYRLTPQLDITTLEPLSGYSTSYLYEIERKLSVATPPQIRQGVYLDSLCDRLLLDGKNIAPVKKKSTVKFNKSSAVIPPKEITAKTLQVLEVLNFIEYAKTAPLPENEDSELYPLKLASDRYGYRLEDLYLWIQMLPSLPQGVLRSKGVLLTKPKANRLVADLVGKPEQFSIAMSTCELLKKVYQGEMPWLGKKLACQKRVQELLSDFLELWIAGTHLSIETDSLPKAKRWIWFLRELKIEEAIVIAHSPSVGKDFPSAKRQRQYWEDQLEISQARELEPKDSGSTRGKIRVDLDLTQISKKKGVPQHEGIAAMFGVRAALSLLALVRAPF